MSFTQHMHEPVHFFRRRGRVVLGPQDLDRPFHLCFDFERTHAVRLVTQHRRRGGAHCTAPFMSSAVTLYGCERHTALTSLVFPTSTLSFPARCHASEEEAAATRSAGCEKQNALCGLPELNGVFVSVGVDVTYLPSSSLPPRRTSLPSSKRRTVA